VVVAMACTDSCCQADNVPASVKVPAYVSVITAGCQRLLATPGLYCNSCAHMLCR
jgi:hypothetical protein